MKLRRPLLNNRRPYSVFRHSLPLLLFTCLLLCAFGRRATGDDIRQFDAHGPLTYRNQNPLYLQIANIVPMRAAAIPEKTAEFRLTTAYSNLFEQFTTATHDLLLDMETLRTSLHGAYGLGHGLTAEIDLPFVHNGGGFLDTFLESYHRTFGFPNAGRENFPRDRFVYRVTEGVTRRIDAPSAGFRLGDIQLGLRQELFTEGRRRPAIGWFAAVDLPTGSTSRGLGNGYPDIGGGVLLEKSHRRWHGYLNAGYFVSGGIDPINHLMRDAFFSSMLGAEFSVSKRLALHMQYHTGTPLLAHMGEQRWDWPPGDLAFGLSGDYPRLLWGHDLLWQVGMSEDLIADGPSIDLTMFTQIGMRFRR